MRIALATDDNHGLDAVLSYHFGRCPYYTLVDVEDKEIKDVKSVSNPFFGSHGNPGEVPSFIRSQGADVIIAGGMGGRAISFFREFGMETVTGASGKVKDAVEAYLGKKIQGAEPCGEGGQPQVPPPGEFEGDDISRLKEEMVALRRQLADAQEKLAKLERGERGAE